MNWNSREMFRFLFHNNDGLCAPPTASFQEWLGRIGRNFHGGEVNGPTCSFE